MYPENPKRSEESVLWTWDMYPTLYQDSNSQPVPSQVRADSSIRHSDTLLESFEVLWGRVHLFNESKQKWCERNTNLKGRCVALRFLSALVTCFIYYRKYIFEWFQLYGISMFEVHQENRRSDCAVWRSVRSLSPYRSLHHTVVTMFVDMRNCLKVIVVIIIIIVCSAVECNPEL